MAAVGIGGRGTVSAQSVPTNAIAVVNGAPILQSDYQRALRALAADLQGDDASPAMRQRVLDRLIEQELLVQRGLELDLASRDPRIRATLTDAVIGLLVARGAPSDEPYGDEQLRAFYQQHRGFFRKAGRLRLQQIWFGDRDSGGAQAARERARQAHRRLALGEDFAQVGRDGDAAPAPLPDAWLPPSKVRDYLGPAAARAATQTQQGQHSSPLRVAGGYIIVRVRGLQLEGAQPFDQVRDQVAAELRRRQGDRALRSFLDERRAAAHIAIAKERL